MNNNNETIHRLAGHLFVVAAASGTGKTSLVRAVLSKMDNIQVSVSYTTRPPRPNDIEGIDYHFITEEQFTQKQANDIFLESAKVYGYHYGTSKQWVMDRLKLGADVILEIDWQGANQIKKQFPDAVTIFVLPPSMAALKDRLEKRSTDSEAVIASRLTAAKEDIRHYFEYDYLIVNDDFDMATAQISTIIKASRLKQNCQQYHLQKLLAELV